MTGGVTATTSRRDLESNSMEYLRKEMKVDKEKKRVPLHHRRINRLLNSVKGKIIKEF